MLPLEARVLERAPASLREEESLAEEQMAKAPERAQEPESPRQQIVAALVPKHAPPEWRRKPPR